MSSRIQAQKRQTMKGGRTNNSFFGGGVVILFINFTEGRPLSEAGSRTLNRQMTELFQSCKSGGGRNLPSQPEVPHVTPLMLRLSFPGISLSAALVSCGHPSPELAFCIVCFRHSLRLVVVATCRPETVRHVRLRRIPSDCCVAGCSPT